MSKLKDRIESYQSASDYKLLNRLPIIIVLNGRSFAKTTQLLDKPYCHKFAECILSTMLKLCTEVEGTLFAYQFNDEIVLVSRNDQNLDTNPWYDNKLQKICSITAASATLHFQQYAQNLELNITGQNIFSSQIFTVPSIGEAINTLIYKQQQNFHIAIQSACLYELIKKYDKHEIKTMLNGLLLDKKVELLSQECNINFEDYPSAFRKGAAVYKVPKIVGDNMKNKWYLNVDPPIFTQDQAFLSNIFRMGADIFRQESSFE